MTLIDDKEQFPAQFCVDGVRQTFGRGVKHGYEGAVVAQGVVAPCPHQADFVPTQICVADEALDPLAGECLRRNHNREA